MAALAFSDPQRGAMAALTLSDPHWEALTAETQSAFHLVSGLPFIQRYYLAVMKRFLEQQAIEAGRKNLYRLWK
jgi:hypothetical protein